MKSNPVIQELDQYQFIDSFFIIESIPYDFDESYLKILLKKKFSNLINKEEVKIIEIDESRGKVRIGTSKFNADIIRSQTGQKGFHDFFCVEGRFTSTIKEYTNLDNVKKVCASLGIVPMNIFENKTENSAVVYLKNWEERSKLNEWCGGNDENGLQGKITKIGVDHFHNVSLRITEDVNQLNSCFSKNPKNHEKKQTSPQKIQKVSSDDLRFVTVM